MMNLLRDFIGIPLFYLCYYTEISAAFMGQLAVNLMSEEAIEELKAKFEQEDSDETEL